MATITFTGKIVRKLHQNADDDYDYIKVPELGRRHCDLPSFNQHKQYGHYVNSDLFVSLLKRLKIQLFGGSILKMQCIPGCVSVDTSGFLAIVTITV